MNYLPDEVLEHIFKFLDGPSLIATLSVCKRWEQISLFSKKVITLRQVSQFSTSTYDFQETFKCALLLFFDFRIKNLYGTIFALESCQNTVYIL